MKETLTQALLSSFVRKLITFISSALLTYGWIDADLSNRLTTEAVLAIVAGITTLATTTWLSYKNVILEFIKTRVGIAMPPTASIEEVTQIAKVIAVENPIEVIKHGISKDEVNNAKIK